MNSSACGLKCSEFGFYCSSQVVSWNHLTYWVRGSKSLSAQTERLHQRDSVLRQSFWQAQESFHYLFHWGFHFVHYFFSGGKGSWFWWVGVCYHMFLLHWNSKQTPNSVTDVWPVFSINYRLWLIEVNASWTLRHLLHFCKLNNMCSC